MSESTSSTPPPKITYESRQAAQKENNVPTLTEQQVPLQSAWVASYVYVNIETSESSTNSNLWTTAIREISTFSGLEQSKYLFENIPKPTEWPSNSNLQFFREGIEPTWEDINNKNGFKITLRIDYDMTDDGYITLPEHRVYSEEAEIKENFTKEEIHLGLSTAINNLFETIFYYIVSEAFPRYPDIVNGIVFAPRRKNPRIFIWLRDDECFSGRAVEYEKELMCYLEEMNAFIYEIQEVIYKLQVSVTTGVLNDTTDNQKKAPYNKGGQNKETTGNRRFNHGS
ncbi:Eukaryotic translation initiation factor 4E [Cucumispora dikerogammari]|nr:Eukaryotic translation initiation factor 4E [Cucumispora dikerogammari]